MTNPKWQEEEEKFPPCFSPSVLYGDFPLNWDLSIPVREGEGDVFVALLFYMQWMYLSLGLFFNVPLFKVDII